MSVPVHIFAAAEYTAKTGLRVVASKGTVEDHLYSQQLEDQIHQYSGETLEFQQQFLNSRPSTSNFDIVADKAAAIDSCNDVTMEEPMTAEWGTMQQQQYSQDLYMDVARPGESIGAVGLEYQKYQHQQFVEPSQQTNIDNGNDLGPTNITNNIEQEIHMCTSDELYQRLNEFDALQNKYHTMLDLPLESKVSIF